MAVWGGLTNSCEKKRSPMGEKERYKHLNAEFQRIARDKKAFFRDQCKEIEENRIGKNTYNSIQNKTKQLNRKIRHGNEQTIHNRGKIK